MTPKEFVLSRYPDSRLSSGDGEHVVRIPMDIAVGVIYATEADTPAGAWREAARLVLEDLAGMALSDEEFCAELQVISRSHVGASA